MLVVMNKSPSTRKAYFQQTMQVQTAAKSQGVHGFDPAIHTHVPQGAWGCADVAVSASTQFLQWNNHLETMKPASKSWSRWQSFCTMGWKKHELLERKVALPQHWCPTISIEVFAAVIFETEALSVAQASLGLTAILFPQLPECWDYICEPPRLAPQ